MQIKHLQIEIKIKKYYNNCMKSLTRYINESYKNLRIRDVTVRFSVEDDDLIVEVPENYLEDQIQTYLDDTIINKIFVGPDYSKKILGKNADNIADAYFEYTGIVETSMPAAYKYDAHYDDKADTQELHNMKLSDFKLVVVFDNFDLRLENEDELENTLKQIFEMCVSDEYDWPIKLIFDSNNLEYKQ